MSRVSEYDGIIFCEGALAGAEVSKIRIELSRQNALLNELKSRMASQAKSFGANAIINYSYKQEKKLFGWDSLSLVGTGTAIIISDEQLLELKTII